MHKWTSVNDIMRDLSVAQGSNIPSASQSLQIFGDKPPPPNNEETEGYLKSCGDVNFVHKPPDLSLIQEMLTVVSNEKDSLDDNKINKNNFSKKISARKRIEKNVALMSILKAREINVQDKHLNISKSPISMFRKKKIPDLPKISVGTPAQSDTVNTQNQYTPSGLANEYYNKYLANSKLKQQNNEDMKKAEPVREVPIRKKWKSEAKFQSLEDSLEKDHDKSGSNYALLRHRHLSLDNLKNCIVCDITAKHGYSFKDEDMNCDIVFKLLTDKTEVSSTMPCQVNFMEFKTECTQ